MERSRDEDSNEDGGAVKSSSFEAELERLEHAVELLEGGELALEDAMKTFEQGFRAWRRCTEILNDARRRIELLCEEVSADGDPVRFPSWQPAAGADLENTGLPVDESGGVGNSGGEEEEGAGGATAGAV